MATTMARPTHMASAPPNPNAEPDAEWKTGLRKQIEESLLPMVDEAKEVFARKLSEGAVDAETQEKLAKEHNDTLKNIRRIADDLYRDQLEVERQQLRWTQGASVERGWSEGIVKQQQAILEQIEKQKKQQDGSISRTNSSQPSQNRQRQWTPGESPSSDREGEYFSRPPVRSNIPVSPGRLDDDHVSGRPRGGSGSSRYDPRSSSGEYARSPIADEPDEMEPSGRPFHENTGSLRRQSSNAGPRPVPEIWKPSISPEEDAVMSRTSALARRGSVNSIGSNNYRPPSANQFSDRPEHTLTRQNSLSSMGPTSYRSPSGTQFPDRPDQRPVARKGSITSIGSQPYRPPSTSQIPERPEPYDDYEDTASKLYRERSAIEVVDEESGGYTKARDRERQPRRGPEGRFRSASGAQRNDEYANTSSPISASSSPVSNYPPPGPSAITSRPMEIPQRAYPSSLTSTRPVANERSFPSEEPSHQPQSSSPLSHGWAGQPRGPANTRTDSVKSRPMSIANENTRATPPPQIRPRVSTQDLRRDRHAPVMKRQTSSQETQTDDTDDDEWRMDRQREDHRQAERQAEMEAQAKRREEEALRKEEEALRKEEEALRKEEDARRKEQEAKRKEEEARRKEAVARRKEAEARRKEEDARRKEEDARRKEADARRKEEEARRRAEEAERLEREAQAKEEAARLKEEETRKKEAEIRRREEEVRRREEELERREAEARKREEQKQKMQQDEARRRNQDARRKEAERREEEVKKKEQELERREAEARRREEMDAQDAIRQVEEMERREAAQAEFRKREEEIRRRTQERRSQEEYEFYSENTRSTPGKQSTSPPTTAPWPIPNRSGSTGTPSQSDRNSGTGSSWTSSSSKPSLNSSTPPTSARTSTSSTTVKPAPTNARSTGPPGVTPRTGTSPHVAAPLSEAEWVRRQEEMAQKQQEAFRREQEQQEMKRQTQASKVLSKEDVLHLFEAHERQWAALPSLEELGWYSFPWPVWKKPKDPEDLGSTQIAAYVLSQFYPGDKSKSTKDRVKEHIKRWHPDRFETKYLPKVRPGEREKVKHGAGVVARALNEMLTRSNVHDVFS